MAGATAVLSDGLDKPSVGLSVINGKHYIEVKYNPTSGAGLNLSTITGGEFTLSGAGAANIHKYRRARFSGWHSRHLSLCRYRELRQRVVNVNFGDGAFADDAGYSNLAETATFTLVSPSAALYSPVFKDTVYYDDLNDKGYIFVTFNDPTGSGFKTRHHQWR